MSVSSTPFRGQQTAPVKYPPIRLPQAALPHWTRPLIRPAGDRPRVYAVRSSSRADLTHEVDMVRETCGCEAFIFQGRDSFPLGHHLRPCGHILDVADYERERAGVPLTATAEVVRCVVCGAPAVPGGIHCRVTSWGRGYRAHTTTRAMQAVDELCGEAL